jgi:energy-coupling factor transporter ATP-binding protein EcfA2
VSVYLTGIHIKDLGGISEFKAEVGSIAIVTGENGTGKTTILESIRTVFEGGSDPDLVRRGCEYGEVTLTFSNGYTAYKRVGLDGYDLKVRTAEGGLVKRPAEYLKQLAPALSFDPIRFLESEPKERAAFLLRVLPLQFSAEEVIGASRGLVSVAGSVSLQQLNELRDGKYAERTALNRQVRDLEGTIAEMSRTLPADDGKDWAAERDRLTDDVAAIDAEIARAKAEIELEAEQARSKKRAEVESRIQELQRELFEYIREVDQKAEACLRETTRELNQRKADLSAKLGEARSKADQQKSAEGVRALIEKRKAELKGHVSREMAMSAAIAGLDELKHRKLRELPIEGLDLRIDRGKPVILIDGIPLDHLNRQKQIFVAIQAVSKASGKMPLILCEAAELSDTHLAELTQAAKEAGLQLVLARWENGEPLRMKTAELIEAGVKGI